MHNQSPITNHPPCHLCTCLHAPQTDPGPSPCAAPILDRRDTEDIFFRSLHAQEHTGGRTHSLVVWLRPAALGARRHAQSVPGATSPTADARLCHDTGTSHCRYWVTSPCCSARCRPKCGWLHGVTWPWGDEHLCNIACSCTRACREIEREGGIEREGARKGCLAPTSKQRNVHKAGRSTFRFPT